MDSEAAIRTLAERYHQQPSEARRMALAEMSSDQADRLTEKNPVAAMGRYLDAASLTQDAALAALGQAGESSDLTLYNYSAARVARLIRDHSPETKTSVVAPGTRQNWHLSLASGKEMMDPRDYDLVVPASWLKTKGIEWEHIRQEGIGSAMVGHIKATPERMDADPAIPPGGYGFPLNASFRFSGNSVSFALQDLTQSPKALIKSKFLAVIQIHARTFEKRSNTDTTLSKRRLAGRFRISEANVAMQHMTPENYKIYHLTPFLEWGNQPGSRSPEQVLGKSEKAEPGSTLMPFC